MAIGYGAALLAVTLVSLFIGLVLGEVNLARRRAPSQVHPGLPWRRVHGSLRVAWRRRHGAVNWTEGSLSLRRRQKPSLVSAASVRIEPTGADSSH